MSAKDLIFLCAPDNMIIIHNIDTNSVLATYSCAFKDCGKHSAYNNFKDSSIITVLYQS